MVSLVIYTDLDGTLLDHQDYNHAAVDELLEALERLGVPVVPATSKTRSELLHIRAELNNRHPFIVENGAAVLIPENYFPRPPASTRLQQGYWVKSFSLPRSHWLETLNTVEKQFHGVYCGFASMSPDTIASLTGLDPDAAVRAARREYGEAIHWLGSDASRQGFIRELEAAGAKVQQGGRFLHLGGACDKGVAMQWLNSLYANQQADVAPRSLAIGDSGNDVSMLALADLALVVRSPAHVPPTVARDEPALLSTACGPEGWNEGVRSILRTLSLDPE